MSVKKSTKKSATKSTKKNAKRKRYLDALLPPSGLSTETLAPKFWQKLKDLKNVFWERRKQNPAKVGYVKIPIGLLIENPYQPKRNLFPMMEELLNSIVYITGTIMPVVVCKVNPKLYRNFAGMYILLDGHRRGTCAQWLGVSYVWAVVLDAPATREEMAALWKAFNGGGRSVSAAEVFNSWSRATTARERRAYLEQISVTSPQIAQDIKTLIGLVGMDETLKLARLNQEKGSKIAPSQLVTRTGELLDYLAKDPALLHYTTNEWPTRIVLWFATTPGAGKEVGESKRWWYPLTKLQLKRGQTQTLCPGLTHRYLQTIMDAVTNNKPFDLNVVRDR